MWHLNTDGRRAHLGAALGYLAEDATAPTYRVGRALYERTWQNGEWDGPDEGRPEPTPDFLRAVCSCGWLSPVMVDMSFSLSDQDFERPAVHRLHSQEKARAYWLAHALAATSNALPDEAGKVHDQAVEWLQTLVRCQPLAALTLAHALREASDAYEDQAVRHARALEVSWEDIGAAASTTRQQVWRKYRGLPPLEGDERSILEPSFPPAYQHEVGAPPYTVHDRWDAPSV